ncbi:MAG: SusD/RagB family nutrient-binding outer membrane lipoprotein [Bacteroidetes bacterium]|nr:SusD/RagB family nutrient-binding outer membrane lipoprotein [Bacteroidota bacterium]
MNLKNITKLALLAAGIVVMTDSCKKQDFSNTDQDNVTSATADFKLILPASLTSTATVIEGSNMKFIQNWMGYWARSGSYQDVTDEETYKFQNDFNVGVWNGLYGNATNYDFIIKGANAKGAGIYEAIGRIMKSLDFQMLVDIYGNVPYTQAFAIEEIRTPAYDKGQDIYDSLFVELDRAIALLKDPDATALDKNSEIAKNDLVFKGNTNAWIQFANTLKLRMILHAYEAPGFDAAGKAAIIEAEGSGFLTSSALLNPGYSGTKPTPFYRAYILTETGVIPGNGNLERANAFAVGPIPGVTADGYYTVDADPRVDFMYTAPSGGHRGIEYGEIAGTNPGNTGDKLSTIGQGYSPDGASSKAWIITNFESFFLQAEARERGLLTSGPSAASLLQSGMDASFAWFGLGATEMADYLAWNAGFPDVDYTAGPLAPGLPGGGLYTILSQKWFALNGFNPWEVWTDWRRTDVVYGEGAGFLPGPPISVNPQRNSADLIPVRLFYPQNEYNYNSANVLAQGTIDVQNTATPASGRIFWDIN